MVTVKHGFNPFVQVKCMATTHKRWTGKKKKNNVVSYSPILKGHLAISVKSMPHSVTISLFCRYIPLKSVKQMPRAV